MRVDNLPAALALRPQIAQSIAAYVRASLEGSVPRATKELCAAMVAAVTFCEPLLIEHRAAARKLGVPIEALNDLWEYARSPHYDSAQRAALAAAVALSREPRALPPPIWTDLHEYYDEGEIVEILSTIGAVNALARISNALDSQLPKDS